MAFFAPFYSQLFREYLNWTLSETISVGPEEEDDTVKIFIEDEFEKISPHKADTFAFFAFFFEREKEISRFISLPNGQEAFIGFYQQLPNLYTRPFPPVKSHFSEDKLNIEVSYHNNPEKNDYSLVSASYPIGEPHH